MCLNLCERVYNRPIKGIREAWKVMEKDEDGSLHFPHCTFEWCNRELSFGAWLKSLFIPTSMVPKNVWITDTNTDTLCANSIDSSYYRYSTGFHVFRNKEDAEHFYGGNVVVPVEVDDIVAEGYQDGTIGHYNLPVLVARKIKFLA